MASSRARNCSPTLSTPAKTCTSRQRSSDVKRHNSHQSGPAAREHFLRHLHGCSVALGLRKPGCSDTALTLRRFRTARQQSRHGSHYVLFNAGQARAPRLPPAEAPPAAAVDAPARPPPPPSRQAPPRTAPSSPPASCCTRRSWPAAGTGTGPGQPATPKKAVVSFCKVRSDR